MPLSTNLVFGCKFDEVAGDRTDYIGRATGTDVNSVGSTAGKIGLAARFVQASSQQLNFGSVAALNGGGTQSWAICGFTRWTQAGGSGDNLITRDATNNRSWMIDRSAADTLRFSIFNGVTTSVGSRTATVPTSGWFWWAVYYDKDVGAGGFGTIGLRIDGGAFSTVECSATPGAGAANVRIGYRDLAGGTYLDGDVDLVYAWRGRVPTSAEFDQVYNGGSGLVIPRSGRRRRTMIG